MTCVYVISEGEAGPVKVGMTDRLKWRLSELQIGNGRPLHLADYWVLPNRERAARVEKAILNEMAPYRMRGEWLDVDEAGICGLVLHRIIELEAVS